MVFRGRGFLAAGTLELRHRQHRLLLPWSGILDECVSWHLPNVLRQEQRPDGVDFFLRVFLTPHYDICGMKGVAT